MPGGGERHLPVSGAAMCGVLNDALYETLTCSGSRWTNRIVIETSGVAIHTTAR